jgi:hypothetical protein
MCRNIKRLRHHEHQPSDQELHDAALQFVRKISGFNAPSKANQAAFDTAVHDVARAGRVLFESLHVAPRRTVTTRESETHSHL